MKVAKKLNEKVMECANSIAKKMVEKNANSSCIWLAYQPELPKEAEKFKKVQ